MLLFRVNRQTIAKFFYPWETLKGRMNETGITLEEEVSEIFFARGATEKVDAIMKRFSVDDWDWDNDDYIEVTFDSDINDDGIREEIAYINGQLAYLWEKAVKEAEENLREMECDSCDETDGYGGCKGRNAQGVCQGGFDEDPKTPPQTPPPNVWNTKDYNPTPKPPVKDEWNVWSR